MATPDSAVEVDGVLLCSICRDFLEDAKILECRHRFCKPCLAQIIDNVATDTTTLCCPSCQQDQNLPEDGIDGIPGDHSLDEILQKRKLERDLEANKKEQVCSACEESTVVVAICPHCGGFLCGACFSAHGTMRAFKSHSHIVTLEDIEHGRETFDSHSIASCASKPKCSLHEDMVLCINCKTCDERICSFCEESSHRKHELEGIEAAGERVKTRILALMEGSKLKENVLKERADYIAGLRERYGSAISVITEQAEAEATRLEESIKQRREDDLRDLENRQRLIKERAGEDLEEVNRGRKLIEDEAVLVNAFLRQFCRDAGRRTQETLKEVRDYQAIAKLLTDDGNNWSLLGAVSEIERTLEMGEELKRESIIRSWNQSTPGLSDLSSSMLRDLCWSKHEGRSINVQIIPETHHCISHMFDIHGVEGDNILSVAAIGKSCTTGVGAQLFISYVDCANLRRISLSALEVTGIKRAILAGKDDGGRSRTICVSSGKSSLFRDTELTSNFKLPGRVLSCAQLPCGGLLVSVEGLSSLYKCDFSRIQSTVTVDEDDLQPPVSLAVATDGTILLCDGESQSLAVSDDGEVTCRFPRRLLADQPMRVSIDRKGFVYVLWNRRRTFTAVVVQYTPRGSLISEVSVSGLTTMMTTMVISGRDVVVLGQPMGLFQFYEKTPFGEMFGQYVMHRDDPDGHQPLSVWLEEWGKATTVQSDTQRGTSGEDKDPEDADEGDGSLITDIKVKIRKSHANPKLVNIIGVIREIHGELCSVVLRGDDIVAVESKYLTPTPKPDRGDKVKIISGRYKGNTGLLHHIEEGRGVVSLDSAPSDCRTLAMDSLVKYMNEEFFGKPNHPVKQSMEDPNFGETTQTAVTDPGSEVKPVGASLDKGLSCGEKKKKSYSKLKPVHRQDTEVKNGTTQLVNTRHQVITAMEQYKSKSLEELRLDECHLTKFHFTIGISSGFGVYSSTPTTTTAQSLFGQPQPASTSLSLFGQHTTTSLSGFGQPASLGSGGSSLFGPKPSFGVSSSTPTTTTAQSLFGQPQPASTSHLLFGQPITTSQSGFGRPASLGSSGSSLFGSKPSFGVSSSTPTTTTAPSLFGQLQPASTSHSLFGQPITTSQSGFAMIRAATQGFGVSSSTPTTTTAPSLFGQLQPASTSHSLFGQPITTSQSGFGRPASLGSSGSSLFGSKPSFGVSSSTPTTTTAQSLFGQPQPASTSHSLFGQHTTTSQSGFGRPASLDSSGSSLFGQKPKTTACKPLGQSTFGSSLPTASSVSTGGFGTTAASTGGDEEVIFIGEKQATPEQIARAERLMLPPHFYLYEDKPPCPGCVGCGEDSELEQRPVSTEGDTTDPVMTHPERGQGGVNEELLQQEGIDESDRVKEDEEDIYGSGSDGEAPGSVRSPTVPSPPSACGPTTSGSSSKSEPASSSGGPAEPHEGPELKNGSGSKTPAGLFSFVGPAKPPQAAESTTTDASSDSTTTAALFSFVKPSEISKAPGSTVDGDSKTAAQLPTLFGKSADSSQSPGLIIGTSGDSKATTGLFSFGKPAEPSQAPESTTGSGSSTTGESRSGTVLPTPPPEVGVTSATPHTSTTPTFCFQSSPPRTKPNVDEVSESSIGNSTSSASVNQAKTQLGTGRQIEKSPLSSDVPQFSCRCPTLAESSSSSPSTGSLGVEESTPNVGKSDPSFAESAKFSFHLDVGTVAASPRMTDKPTIQSPALDHSVRDRQDHATEMTTLEVDKSERGEEVRFKRRTKLYRWDSVGKLWKERGVGKLKVLYNPETEKYRIVMRREQVLKVCANHFITRHVDLQHISGTSRSWAWHAMDASDGEVSAEQLAVRFKTDHEANEFKEAVDEAKQDT